jgi:hypothetical protein
MHICIHIHLDITTNQVLSGIRRSSAFLTQGQFPGSPQVKGTNDNLYMLCIACFSMFKCWFCWKYQCNKCMYNSIDICSWFFLGGGGGYITCKTALRGSIAIILYNSWFSLDWALPKYNQQSNFNLIAKSRNCVCSAGTVNTCINITTG